MQITPAVLEVLRKKEGFPNSYAEIKVLVTVGRQRKRLSTLTYLVTPVNQLPFDLPVTKQYRRLIFQGARKFSFSSAYREFLKRVLKPAESRRVSRKEVPEISLLNGYKRKTQNQVFLT